MTHLFIINPAAGSRDKTEQYRAAIEKSCDSRGLVYRIAVSACPGDCARIAREAAETGEEYRIYACGGDGTLSEVASAAAGKPNVAITHFAGGSGNDFVKVFSETDPFRVLERLLDCEETTFDMIRVNDDLCLNISSVGLDARIGTDVANYKRLPLLQGSRAYIVSTAINVFKAISEHYIVEVDGERLDGKFTMICVCNGRFYGGGFNPVPEADLQDGKLDILLIGPVSLLQVAKVVGKYKAGRYKELPHLARHIRTDRIRILCDKPTKIQLDGEPRVMEDITMRIAQEKVRFFYPKGLSFAAKEPALT